MSVSLCDCVSACLCVCRASAALHLAISNPVWEAKTISMSVPIPAAFLSHLNFMSFACISKGDVGAGAHKECEIGGAGQWKVETYKER